MGYFHTQVLKEQLDAGESLDGKLLTMSLWQHASMLDDDDDRAILRAVTTKQSLEDLDGWEEVTATGYAPASTTPNVASSGTNNYLTLNTSLVAFPNAMEPTRVEAVVFSVAAADIGLSGDPVVLFGSTTPFFQRTTFNGGDGISARVDTAALVGQAWLFGWATNDGLVTAVVEGTMVAQQTAPAFETSHVHHAWILPQRINYIANPSWEAGVTHWQTSTGVMSRVAADAEYPSHWLGHAVGVAPSGVLPQYNPLMRLYLKSNTFYPRAQDFTFHVMAKGYGIARIGLAYWPRDYSEHAVDWGMLPSFAFEEWELDYRTFTEIRGVRRMSDGYEGALLIEVRRDGGTPEIYLDKTMIEEGILLDWNYFDGDSTYGATDDFSWYGPGAYAEKRGKSYSLWYNNRGSIAGRLFGRRIDDTAFYTSTDEQLDSLVTQWTPAGAVVVPHWDVLQEDDMQTLPADQSATTLPITVYPELAQHFRVLDSSDVTTSSASVRVVGEGAYPVTDGHIRSGSVVEPLLTITRDPYDPADLYNLTVPQTLNVTWAENVLLVPPFTIYLERDET